MWNYGSIIVMKKLLVIVFLGLIICNITYAKKNKNTWDYPLLAYKGWEIKGSENHKTSPAYNPKTKDEPRLDGKNIK